MQKFYELGIPRKDVQVNKGDEVQEDSGWLSKILVHDKNNNWYRRLGRRDVLSLANGKRTLYGNKLN